MAIGDTVQAGLMRIDPSAIERAGQANANANQAFGLALGEVAKGYFIGQEKKARANEIKEELMRSGLPEEAAANISKNPFLQKEHARKQEAESRMNIARLAQSSAGDALAQKAAFEETRIKERNEAEQSATNIAKFNLDRPDLPITEETPAAFLPELDPDPFVGPPTTYQGQAPAVAQLPESFQPQGAQVVDAVQSGRLSPLEGNRIMDSIQGQAMAERKDAPSISRVVNMEDGQGGFQQVGVDSAGNPIRTFGPPKPSGMFATPDQQADARAKTLSVDNANEFVNAQRNSALDSAKSIRPATRALTLLEKGDLKTGGISELKTNAIAMLDSLGIPIDKETMDKVSNTQNFRAEVGKFLFENISNTKGSISEKEMDIFAKISPGLQMTPEANKTLLNYVIKKAERDKEKVKFIQKMRRDGVSITEQRNKLEDYMLDNDLSEILSPIAGETSEQQPFRSPQGNVNGKVVGTKPNGDKLIEVNGKIFVQPAQ